ncbi:MAG TPA: adenylate/guanylate cyclase domain-containing protein [Verrucomicrobiae bacterium]|nr:adenylate/guanylate cyclase domain-containing protein [Verrucomicrobiae bacterium]
MITVADILKASILIVDDKDANISLLEQTLRGAGYSSINSTSHPREVVGMHRRNRYSLILLDLQMPGMDGFQVMEELKTIETDGYLPVLVVTAQPDLKLRALKAGAKDFVSKPFELAEVLIRVYNILEVRLLHLETKKLYECIAAEQKVSEALLLNVLPRAIADRLKTRPAGAEDSSLEIADSFPEATILFAGLHDFSRLTESMPPTQVVQNLNTIYSRFDAITEKLGLEKIKIMGASYMIAGGVPVQRADHAEAIADAALEFQEEIASHHAPGGETFSVRIGINTGPVVAGVIGKTKFSYDVWGETVNTAWNMETYGAPGCIQVNETTHARLRDKYIFEDRGDFFVKDKADLRTYFLKTRKAA